MSEIILQQTFGNIRWTVEVPSECDAIQPLDNPGLTRNEKVVKMRLAGNKDFLFWGEPSCQISNEVRKVALSMGYSIVTLYLEDAVEPELEGGVIIDKTDSGLPYYDFAKSPWATYIDENLGKKFLLLIDEAEKVDYSVISALSSFIKDKAYTFDNPEVVIGMIANLDSEDALDRHVPGTIKSLLAPVRHWKLNE